MSKKDYQAIAGAIYSARTSMCAKELERKNSDAFDGFVFNIESSIALALQANNPRFDRQRFIEACKTGKTKGMRQVGGARPQCAIAMGCLCALHARGGDASEVCDARE